MFENRENTAVSAAILRSAVRVNDVMKVGTRGSSIKDVTSQPFFCSSSVKSEPVWLGHQELIV